MNNEVILLVEYIGRIDSHTIEIKLLSSDDLNQSYRSFQLSQDIIDNFDTYDLSTSDLIEITFFNDSTNDTITKIKKYEFKK